jgi:hypothetical protein
VAVTDEDLKVEQGDRLETSQLIAESPEDAAIARAAVTVG